MLDEEEGEGRSQGLKVGIYMTLYPASSLGLVLSVVGFCTQPGSALFVLGSLVGFGADMILRTESGPVRSKS